VTQLIRILMLVGCGVLGLGLPGTRDISAQEPTAAATEPDGAALYMSRTCFACHGKDAATPLMPNYPKLAGQNAAYLLQQMIDIKSGARANAQTAAMKGVMHLVNEREMEALATYLSQIKPSTPTEGK
jgi:cytochrome c